MVLYLASVRGDVEPSSDCTERIFDNIEYRLQHTPVPASTEVEL